MIKSAEKRASVKVSTRAIGSAQKVAEADAAFRERFAQLDSDHQRRVCAESACRAFVFNKLAVEALRDAYEVMDLGPAVASCAEEHAATCAAVRYWEHVRARYDRSGS